ncbi:PREDICTED: vitelline membrane protein Vm26Ab-like [Rhagoletis zephyria]|uniref:vitelline membrane protein Vm26Ab-like n=1 Tax=Rhagoletis zephyria TaxID=28612 RepID=UPI0008119EAC|nr:PREDICTED: vitelline membrane protein Vm26Ab-like [Rhagoletis zephyria]XP_017494453.1 PREDICTED: vitelline membrane protein Vm26Ab-like [Rhagoletis zephyria]
MFKSCILFAVLAFVACASAKPAVVAYSAPGVVTAQSSQYIARNYNGVAAAPVVAAAYTAPAVAAAPVAAAYSAPVAAAYTAPVAAAYSAPVAAAYTAPVAAAYTAPVAAAYSAPVASYPSYASYYPYNAAYTVAF